MNDRLGQDLSTGSIPKHLINFSMPMLAGNLMQAGYSIVNTIWIGKIIGENAVGAVSVSFPVIFILIAIAGGATLSTTILISHFYGAKKFEMVERVVSNSFSIALILSMFLTLVGLLTSDLILNAINTPEQIFEMASGYLKITLSGFIIMYFNFLITSILRGVGNTKTPLLFMLIGFVMNAILDPLLIIGIGPFPKLGLNGAAIAALISQFTAVMSALFYLNRKKSVVSFNLKKLRLDVDMVKTIFRLGFPSIIQQSLVSMGALFINSYINGFGAYATAAYGAASRIEAVAFLPAMSIGMAASALTGQNLGAGKPERVKEIFRWSVLLTTVITLVISTVAVSFPIVLLKMFVNDAKVLSTGSSYLRIAGGGYILFAIMFASNGVINGAGHTMSTMIFTLASLWLIRIPLAAFLPKTGLGITGIWVSILSSFAFTMSVSLLYYKSGRWKKPVSRNNEILSHFGYNN